MSKKEILVFVFRDRGDSYASSVRAGLESLIAKHPLLATSEGPNVDIIRYTNSEDFSAQISKYTKLRGLVLDSSFFSDYSSSVYKLISSFEELGLPTLRFSHSFISDLPEERQLFKTMWDAFVKALVQHEPRQLRAEDRKSFSARINLQSEISPPEAASSNSIRVVTANISRGGCFIVHCDPKIQIGDLLQLAFEGSPLVVDAKACWISDWADSKTRFPGVGVQFLNDSDEFQNFLRMLLSEAQS